MDCSSLGARVRMYRREQNLTQEQLAEAAGISASFLGHIERGTRVLSVDTLLCLCRALHVTPNDLLGVALAAHADDELLQGATALLMAALDILRKRSAC